MQRSATQCKVTLTGGIKNAVLSTPDGVHTSTHRSCCVCLGRHIESSGESPDRRCSSQPESLGADQEATNGLKHSKKRLLWGVSRPCGLQRAVNTEQALKTLPRKPTRHNNGQGRRRRRRDENSILRFRRGIGGGTYGTDSMCNKGSLPRCPCRGNAKPVRASGGPGRWRMGP